MKKVICVLLVAANLLAISACGGNFTPSTPDTLPQPTQETEIFNQASQLPMIAVALPTTTVEHHAQDSTLLLRTVYQNIELTVPDPEVADGVILDFLNRTDAIIQNSEVLLMEATSKHQTTQTITPYLAQLAFTPKRIDQSVFSLFGAHVEYKGTSHPDVNALSLNYDLSTGQPIHLTDIIAEDGKTSLINLLLESLSTKREQLYEHFESTVQDLSENRENWYFSEDGIVFYFSPYEIAPYSAGVVTAVIPYKELVGILDDAYFPREKDSLWGELSVLPFTQENTNKFTQSVEAIQGSGNGQAILYTNGMLENVRIEIVTAETSQAVLFAHTLTPGDAIVLHGEVGQVYDIHYSSSDGTETRKLTISQDGTPSLS